MPLCETTMKPTNTLYQTFNRNQVNYLNQPMFFGESLNVARYDQQTHPIFEKLIEKQLSFFWRPEEVDVSKDRMDFEVVPCIPIELDHIDSEWHPYCFQIS